MFHALNGRPGHYGLLTLVWASLCLVNLGQPSLWDIDEGNNAEAAREMYEADDWIVPTFNGMLRVDKPALLYWFQMSAYDIFGINEFSARLPSALAALAGIFLCYEIGRRMFGSAAGLLAGLILSSTILFCAAGHFANPDALLNACGLLTFYFFWRDYERGGHSWLVLTGISSGLGMLAKGPVGLVLPSAVLVLFLLWNRQLSRFFHRRIWGGVGMFILVAVPWYAWVSADTKAEFLRGFFLQHNVNRFLEPMENHRGPVVYYLGVLLVGFAPWSIFFAATGWHVWKCRQREQGPDVVPDVRYRFLLCWVAVYLLFFSLSRTKLPNYVLPIYPPLAMMMGHFLQRWRRGEVTPPAWTLHAGMAALCLTGVLTTFGLLFGGGVLGGDLLRGRHLPGLEKWAALGLIPLLAGLVGWWMLLRQRRTDLLFSVAVSALLFIGALAGWATAAVDQYKAPRPLGLALRQHVANRDVIVASYQYFQPSLVFYCQREVRQLHAEHQALELLQYAVPVYLFVPASTWDHLQPKIPGPRRELARHRDLYRGFDVVLITNR